MSVADAIQELQPYLRELDAIKTATTYFRGLRNSHKFFHDNWTLDLHVKLNFEEETEFLNHFEGCTKGTLDKVIIW